MISGKEPSTAVVPAQAGTHTPCPLDRLWNMDPGPSRFALGRDDGYNLRHAN
jgi:hypothetical protein